MSDVREDALFIVAQEWVGAKCPSLTLNRASKRIQGKGGPELALVNLRQGVFIVQLKIAGEGYTNYHCVAFNAQKGLFVDNNRHVGPLELKDSDRASSENARKVLRRTCLYNDTKGYKVFANNLYELTLTE